MVLDFMPDGCFLTDLDSCILEFNPAGARLLGQAPELLQGAPLLSFLSEPARTQIEEFLVTLCPTCDGVRGAWEAPLLRPALPSLLASIDAVALPREGDERLLVGWFIHDSSRRRAAEVALHDSNSKLQALVRAAPVAINAINMNGIVTVWNPESERIFGWRADETIGRPPRHVRPEQMERFLAQFKRLLQGETLHNIEIVRHRKDGSPVELSISAAPLHDMEGQIIGAISVAIDVTERKKAERELAEARHRLAENRESEALRVARDLHDGAVQHLIALRYKLEEARRLAVEEPGELETLAVRFLNLDRGIVQVVEQLRGVVGELRPSGLEEEGLAAALERYVARLQRETGGTIPQLDCRIGALSNRLPPQVALQLFRVAQEALRNALRHAAASRIELRLAARSGEVRLEVRDYGVGFTQEDSPAALARGGHFGLIGMRERIEGVGGTLEVTSYPGRGTSVLARVPLRK